MSLAGGGFARVTRRARPALAACTIAATTACGVPSERADTARLRQRADTIVPATPLAQVTVTTVRCLTESDGVVRVSRDSIGPLPSRLTYTRLREICPTARDTVAHDYESVSPALLVPSPAGSMVLATQGVAMVEDSAGEYDVGRPEPDRLIDAWDLRGPSIHLPGGLPANAPWSDLMRRYGPALVITELSRLDARFCGLPYFYFVFEGGYGQREDNFVMFDSLSPGIPPDIRADEITVSPDASPGSRPDSAQCRAIGKR